MPLRSGAPETRIRDFGSASTARREKGWHSISSLLRRRDYLSAGWRRKMMLNALGLRTDSRSRWVMVEPAGTTSALWLAESKGASPDFGASRLGVWHRFGGC